jgi:hypothetical protein
VWKRFVSKALADGPAERRVMLLPRDSHLQLMSGDLPV